MGRSGTTPRAQLGACVVLGLGWLLAATVVFAAPGSVRVRIADLTPGSSHGVVPSAALDVIITSSAGYLYDSGGTSPGVAALGEILNLAPVRRTDVTVRADFYDESVLMGSLSGAAALQGVAWG